MKFFTDPKVYLIAEPSINWKDVHQFFKDMGNYDAGASDAAWVVNDYAKHGETVPAQVSAVKDADLLPEFCGRMCYCSFGKRQGRTENREYLRNIISMGHGSVLEHANFTFLVTQCSRGFTHEMVRHRAGFAYSQESTHYVDYSTNNGRIILDERSCKVEALADEMKSLAEHALGAYSHIYQSLHLKYKKKDACSMARQMLPIGIEAKLAFTGNIRALRHFLVMRGNANNVLEIRKVAALVYNILDLKAPNSLQGLKLERAADGFSAIAVNYGGKV